jgi:hypothetical protein
MAFLQIYTTSQFRMIADSCPSYVVRRAPSWQKSVGMPPTLETERKQEAALLSDQKKASEGWRERREGR